MKWACRKTNPFGLTDRQAQAVAALVRLGTDKAVAQSLKIDPRAAATLLRHAQRDMGAKSRVQMALMWDRRTAGIVVGVRNSVFQVSV